MEKTILAAIFAASPAFADDAAYKKASGAFSAATGAMIVGNIEGPGLGFGVGNIGGHTGVGVRLSLPLYDNVNVSIGTFRIEDGVSGSVASITFEF